MKYKEIFKLKKLLEKNKLPFKFYEERIPEYDHVYFQLYYDTKYFPTRSVVQGEGTYGNENDKLEIQGLLKRKGYLTAREVFEIIKNHHKNR